MFERKFVSWIALAFIVLVMLNACAPIAPVAEAPSEEAAATAAPEEAAAEEEGDEEPPERGAAPEAEMPYVVGDILVYNADPWSKIKVTAVTETGFDFEFCNDADCASSGGGGALDLAFDGDAILTVDEARASSDIPDDQKQALNLLPGEATGEEASAGEDTPAAEETTSEEVTASGNSAAVEEAAVCTGPSEADIATILAEHERIRQEATAIDSRNRAPQLQWSAELACQAEEWAKASVAGTQSENPHRGNDPHSNLATWANAPLAESMAGGYEAAQDAVRAWEEEKHDYDLMTGDCSAVCGHYRFIIMPNMTEVGCGFAKVDTQQPNGYATSTWVCQYRGTYPWEEGKDFVIWDTQTVDGTTTTGWWAARAEKVEGGGVRLRPLFEDGTVDTSFGYSVSMGSVDVWPLEVAKQKGFQINY